MGTKEDAVSMHVWAPDDLRGFVLCRLVDIASEWVTLQPVDGTPTFKAFYDNIFPAEEDISRDVDDNCSLMYLNDGSLLHNCRLRYNRKQLYTYVANILIAINPYEQIPGLYDIDMIRKYKGKSLGTLPPHIFAIADKAYRDMMRNHESQSIVISGESGAGKTESQKHILRFLCESWGQFAGTIEQRILEISTILESFGNAKTARNNNSSRFGKFIEIHFNDKGAIVGGFVSHYLLERSRLCSQHSSERNYHIFYQLIAGADDQLARKLKLSRPENFNYLKKGCTKFFLGRENSLKVMLGRNAWASPEDHLQDDLIDDYSDFQKLLNAFQRIDVPIGDRNAVLEAVAAILHLGNIEFVDETIAFKAGCTLNRGSDEHLLNAAELLGLEAADLKNRLTTRYMQPIRGGAKGTLYAVPLRPSEANVARDALAKAIYGRLFDAIVTKITKCMPFSESAFSIGVLDTAGFEALDINSYEQFCINYCNEKLQSFFNERILLDEQNLYCKEQLDYYSVEFDDNKDCIELFEQKLCGIFELLDNEARLPQSSPQHFTTAVHTIHAQHPCLMAAHTSRQHRAMRDDEGFIICHYAADVCYDTAEFLDKNNDTLHASLQCLMQQSKKSLICELFDDNELPENFGRDAPLGKLVTPSVGNKFRAQLDILLEKLHRTGTHFVRCIKPNGEMKSDKFDGGLILTQLKCAGMSSAVKVMQRGFPSRVSYRSLYNMYRKYLPNRLLTLDAQFLCKCLFRVVGLKEKDYKFGLTKAFFRPGKFAEFDKMLHQDKENIENLVEEMSSWLHRFRFRKIQFAILSLVKVERLLKYRAKCRIRIQNAVRGYLARKANRPRISALSKLSALWKHINEMLPLIGHLNEPNLYKWSAIIDDLKQDVKILVYNIKHNENPASSTELLQRCNALVNGTKQKLFILRQQIVHDELQRIQEKKDRARLQAEQKQREKFEKEQIELRKAKEKIRKQEEEEEEEKQQITQYLKELVEHTENMEQEERQQKENDSRQTYDLSEWRYIDIRNGINSNDPKLSAACKNEYYRRLRAYSEWKERNMASKGMPSIEQRNQQKSENREQREIHRYFRVIASRLTNREKNLFGIVGKSAFTVWYAHFKNGFVCRQLEISPHSSPILRVAGQDDKNICKMMLKETKLNRRKGFEINGAKFERVWTGNGGKPYAGEDE